MAVLLTILMLFRNVCKLIMKISGIARHAMPSTIKSKAKYTGGDYLRSRLLKS